MIIVADIFCIALFSLSISLHILPVTEFTHCFQPHYSEVGFVEGMSILVLLVAAFQCLKISGNEEKKGYWWFLVSIFIFLTGEEISWFQRMFNLTVPDFFIIWNDQQEINFHGLNYKEIFIETLLIPIFAISFYPLFRKSPWKLRIRFLLIAVLEFILLFQEDQPLKESFLEEGFELISYVQFTQIFSIYLTNRTPTPNPKTSLVTGLWPSA